MRKLTALETKLLQIIADQGGSFCFRAEIDPLAVRALGKLAASGRLTVEETDLTPRYHLTAQGRADAS